MASISSIVGNNEVIQELIGSSKVSIYLDKDQSKDIKVKFKETFGFDIEDCQRILAKFSNIYYNIKYLGFNFAIASKRNNEQYKIYQDNKGNVEINKRPNGAVELSSTGSYEISEEFSDNKTKSEEIEKMFENMFKNITGDLVIILEE